jgi:large subunit ribosomal protein L13
MQKSYYPKKGDVQPQWYIVDASGKNLGRLASRIATILLGKHRPQYTPGVDLGDSVIVTHCAEIVVTGTKLTDKMYYSYSGYQGGLSEATLRRMLRTHPDRVIREAVWGMLPHNKMGRQLIKKLKVYSGAEHPHEAQKPQPLAMK